MTQFQVSKKVDLEGQSSKCYLINRREEEKTNQPWNIRKDKSVSAVVVVYDSHNPDSFSNAWGWVFEVDKYLPNCKHRFLLGTKSDLGVKVSSTKAQDFAKKAGMSTNKSS